MIEMTIMGSLLTFAMIYMNFNETIDNIFTKEHNKCQ